MSDPADRTTTFDYDAAGRLVHSTDALGHGESFGYDGAGNKRQFTNKNGNTWTYDYDAAGRLVSETAPAVSVVRVAVDQDSGKLFEMVQESVALRTVYQYDAFGDLVTRTEAAGLDGQERVTQYEYDALGRQVKTIFPSVATYNAAGDSLQTEGAAGAVERSRPARRRVTTPSATQSPAATCRATGATRPTTRPAAWSGTSTPDATSPATCAMPSAT